MIYLDNAATTRPDPKVIEQLLPYLSDYWGNASSPYSFGDEPSRAIEMCRKTIADYINASPEEIYFTSGGSESNSWAIRGYTDLNPESIIVTTPIEHMSIINACSYLAHYGKSVHRVDIDEKGKVKLDSLGNLIKSATNPLVSIQFANNEIGTIQDIPEIAKIVHQYKGVLHVDAVQAFGHVDIDVKKLGIDMMSVSGHKVGAPKGIGFLYKKKNIAIAPLIYGGKQEFGLRGGTENVPYIVALGMAVALLSKIDAVSQDYLKELRDHLIDSILQTISESYIVGDLKDRLCNNVCVCIPGIASSSLVSLLDMRGFCVSSGSACTSNTTKASHVLEAIGLSVEDQHSCIRISLGPDNTLDDINKFVDALEKSISTINRMKNSDY